MKKPRKAYDPNKRLRQSAIGIKLSWSDATPEEASDHLVDGEITHKNPLRKKDAAKIWASKFGQKLVDEMRAYWRIEITGVFAYPNGITHEETHELFAFEVLNSINEIALETVREIARYGSNQITTKFTIELLGWHPPRNRDDASLRLIEELQR